MSTKIIIFVCVAIVTLIAIAIFIQVKKRITSPILKDRDSNLETPLEAFRESHGYDTIIKNAIDKPAESISKLFEEMCVLNPLDYEEDERLPQVLKGYKSLLSGKIEDPEGKHIPSEILNNHRNVDYAYYLKAQIRVLGKKGVDVSWFRDELKRFNAQEKALLIEVRFIETLEALGAPESISWAFINEVRMNSFKPVDWKELVTKVKEYSEVYTDEVIVEFLENINDIDTLINENKMEAFCNLIDLGIEGQLATAYINEDISPEDLQEVCIIKDKYSMDSEEALKYVLEEKAKVLKTINLKSKYRGAING